MTGEGGWIRGRLGLKKAGRKEDGELRGRGRGMGMGKDR